MRIDFSVDGIFNLKDAKTPYFPLLEEVFKEFPKILINVEIKTPT
jgi:hypothetical protein